jgi:hypothetical protein
MIGPVPAGCIFSLLQSAGSGGACLAVINIMVSAGAGAGIAAVAAKQATKDSVTHQGEDMHLEEKSSSGEKSLKEK